MMKSMSAVITAITFIFLTITAMAMDIDGSIEHPMIERYPGQVIA